MVVTKVICDLCGKEILNLKGYNLCKVKQYDWRLSKYTKLQVHNSCWQKLRDWLNEQREEQKWSD